MNEFLESAVLDIGDHSVNEPYFCAMELAAVLAGEMKTDEPSCVSRLYAALLRYVNDNSSEEDRQRLKKYIPEVIGTSNVDWKSKVKTLVQTSMEFRGAKNPESFYTYSSGLELKFENLQYRTTLLFEEGRVVDRYDFDRFAEVLMRFVDQDKWFSLLEKILS